VPHGRRPRSRQVSNLHTQVLEAALYNLYWVWSMVALILFGNLAEAQRVMQNTTDQVTGQERLARKVVFKVFSDLASDPERHIELFLHSTFLYEAQKLTTDFSLTKRLLSFLRRRDLLPPENCHLWELRLRDTHT